MAESQPPEGLQPRALIFRALRNLFHALGERGWVGHSPMASDCHSCNSATDAVLAEIEAAGRLLPPGGEVSTQWLVLNVGGFWREGCPDEAAARGLFLRVCDINRGNGSTYEMRRRQVVTTPDGFKAKWPWEVVERSPVVSDNSEVPNVG